MTEEKILMHSDGGQLTPSVPDDLAAPEAVLLEAQDGVERRWWYWLSALQRLIPLATLVALIIIWWLVVVVFNTPRYILPTPWAVLHSIGDLHSTLAKGTWITTREILLGFVVGVAVGIVVAAVAAASPTLERIVMPPIVASQAIPKIAVAPLFLLWFGLGLLPVVLIAATLSFFPVVIAGVTALKSIDPALVSMARACRASTLRVFWKIRLPLAAPGILSGIKLAMTFSAIGAIIGEFIDPKDGLGGLILTAQGNQNTPAAFAGLVVLSVLTLVLYYLVVLLDWIVVGRKTSR